MSDDSLFFRTAELSNILKHLKLEESMRSAELRGCEGYETTASSSSDRYLSNNDDSQQPVDEVEQLNELRSDVWEATVELETLFLELAKSEFARIESIVEEVPGRDLGAVCLSAVKAMISRYAQNFGSLLSKNNNAAHLLLEFSSHLDPGDQSDSRDAVTSITDVRIPRAEDDPRYSGVSVNNQEVRFIDVEVAFDQFQTKVLKAVEDWKLKRLERVQRRAEVRKQLRDEIRGN